MKSMLNKIKETRLDMSVKSGLIIMAILFLLTFFLARWINIDNQTIEQSMVLHHEVKEEMNELQRRYHYDLQLRKHRILFKNINLPLPPVSRK